MRNALFAVLILLLGYGILRNHPKKIMGEGEAYAQAITSPTPLPAKPPVVAIQVSEPIQTPTPKPKWTPLVDDEEQLKGQLGRHPESGIDHQMEQTQAQIATLRNQLQESLNEQSTMQQSANTMLQFQQASNQQTIAQANAQMQNLNEKIQYAQNTLYRLQWDYDPGVVQEQRDLLHANIDQMEQQKQVLSSYIVQLNAEGSASTNDIGDRVAAAQNQYANERATITTQIGSLQGELNRLAQAKMEDQQTRSFIQMELNDVEQRAKREASAQSQ